MSRLHRAIEKADREGLLTWTRPIERPSPHRPEREPAPPPVDGVRHRAPVFPVEPRTSRPSAPPDVQPADSATLSPLLVAATAPASAAAEQFRVLRTRLEASDATRRVQVLLVTSPRLGDGKTITSANLALTMSREFDHRVVLLESDMRRPSLAERFGVRPEPGLADVLVGAVALEDALVAVGGQQLTLLPAGGGWKGSMELLGSSMMQSVLESLRSRFDRIVIDAPPAMLADTHVLARLADGLLVVVRAGVTPRPALERSLEVLPRERLLGVVLNEVDEAPDQYSYRQYAGQWK